MEEKKPRLWAIVTVTVAVLSCVGMITAAIIEVVLPVFIPRPTTPHDPPTESPEAEAKPTTPTNTPSLGGERTSPSAKDCIVTIHDENVPLMDAPVEFSEELIKVPPGEYLTLDYEERVYSNEAEGWFQIEVDGLVGWIKDVPEAIDGKTAVCP